MINLKFQYLNQYFARGQKMLKHSGGFKFYFNLPAGYFYIFDIFDIYEYFEIFDIFDYFFEIFIFDIFCMSIFRSKLFCEIFSFAISRSILKNSYVIQTFTFYGETLPY